MKILVSILCGSERTNWINPDLLAWILDPNDSPQMKMEISLEKNIWPVARARNAAAQKAIDVRADWHIQIDNDAVPHRNFLQTLNRADEGGLEFFASVSPTWLASYPANPIGLNFSEEKIENPFEDQCFREVAAVGGGCFAVRTSVFSRLQRPYFRMELDPTKTEFGLGDSIGEDIGFCRSLRRAGVRVLIAKQVIAQHFKTADLLFVYEKLRINPPSHESQQPPENGKAIAAAASSKHRSESK